jgi:tetratricopeptide (TPR) repeat protein
MQPATAPAAPLGRRDWLAAAALASLTFVAFARALGCGFVNYDDTNYVTRNPQVTAGLSAAGARWAFSTFHAANWHPLTWLSLQLDATLWGAEPFGFHLTSVLLHAANAALLFLALRALTGAYWRSAAVALLFAVHPLRVESVAWVSERKDVLSTLFGFLALWAYAGYAKAPSVPRYLLVGVALALSLLAKPMLVTLPCLLLVLDWWPLARTRVQLPVGLAPPEAPGLAGTGRPTAFTDRPTPGRSSSLQAVQTAPAVKSAAAPAPAARQVTPLWLAVEKLPLLALAAISSAVTVQVQAAQGAVMSVETYPLAARFANAAVSYAGYLLKTVWPTNLAAYYPHPGTGLPAAEVAGAALLLAVLTVAAVALRGRAPYLLAGWLWFLGTLVPVIGLVQVGLQALADRYTYFPQVGLLLAACWGAADLARGRAGVALAAGAAAAVVLAVLTWRQVAVWHDPLALWKQVKRTTRPSPTALINLGNALEEQGLDGEATRYYREAVRAFPENVDAHLNLAAILLRTGNTEEAEREYQEVLKLNPGLDIAHFNLGVLEASRGNYDRAADHFRTVIRVRSDFVDAHSSLGKVFARQGNLPEAEREQREAVRLAPGLASTHFDLGGVLFRQRKLDEAAREFEAALRLDARLTEAHSQLGLVMEARGDLTRAAAEFEQVTLLSPRSALAWYDLGRVHFRQGRLAEAVACFRRAVELDPSSAAFRKALEAARQAQGRPGDAAVPGAAPP